LGTDEPDASQAKVNPGVAQANKTAAGSSAGIRTGLLWLSVFPSSSVTTSVFVKVPPVEQVWMALSPEAVA